MCDILTWSDSNFPARIKAQTPSQACGFKCSSYRSVSSCQRLGNPLRTPPFSSSPPSRIRTPHSHPPPRDHSQSAHSSSCNLTRFASSILSRIVVDHRWSLQGSCSSQCSSVLFRGHTRPHPPQIDRHRQGCRHSSFEHSQEWCPPRHSSSAHLVLPGDEDFGQPTGTCGRSRHNPSFDICGGCQSRSCDSFNGVASSFTRRPSS